MRFEPGTFLLRVKPGALTTTTLSCHKHNVQPAVYIQYISSIYVDETALRTREGKGGEDELICDTLVSRCLIQVPDIPHIPYFKWLQAVSRTAHPTGPAKCDLYTRGYSIVLRSGRRTEHS